MLKRIFLLCVPIFAAAMLHAAQNAPGAVAIGNTRDGYPLIIPQVKELKPAAGTFQLPEKLTVAAPVELDLAPLAKIYAQTVKAGELVRTGDSKAACRFELAASGALPASPEGYTLDIAPGGITVRSRDVRGLFYGMHSLGWLLRGRNETGALKCCFIADWPDLEIRGLYYQLAYVNPKNIDRVCHVIDVLGSLKYNALLIGFFDNFPYEDTPFTKRKSTYSKDDIAKIAAAAKRNHIEIIPKLQVISHAAWILNHRDWTGKSCEFYEGPAQKSHHTMYCPASPKALELVKKMVRETAETFKPRYFHLGLDEILLGGYPMCPKCAAADPTQQIVNHVRPIKDMLKDMGIQTIIYHDDYFGSSAPVTKKQISIEKVPEGLGTDIMINSWEYEPSPSRRIGDKIRARGFNDLIYMSFAVNIDNCWKLPKIAHATKSKGNFLAYWSIVPPTLDRHDNSAPDFYPSTLAQANYTWNASDIDFNRIPIDSANILRELLDGKPEREFRGQAVPVEITGACNTMLGADPMFPIMDAKLLDTVKQIAAADRAKFALATAGEHLGAIVLSGTPGDGRQKSPVKIPIGVKASGASFLMTASSFNTYGMGNGVQSLPVGELAIVYDDGKSAKVPLVCFRNLNDWNSYIGGNACRPVLRGNDCNKALFSFYAIDWRNPRPDSTIREIVFSSNGKSLIAPVLLAMSLSDAAQTPAGAPGAPQLADDSDRSKAKCTVITDFSQGLPEGWRKLVSGVPRYQARIVNDPERGKVLEINIPSTTQVPARAGIDLPLENPCDFKNIAFDIKVSSYDLIARPDFYVMNRQATNVLAVLGYTTFLGNNWQTVCIPRERFVPKEGGGIDPAKANCIRIGFFLNLGNKPTRIRIAKVYFCDRMLPGRSNNLTPGK